MFNKTPITPSCFVAGFLFAGIATLTFLPTPVSAEKQATTETEKLNTDVRHHAMSLVGEPEYGPDFTHFNWVNPDAPKGGKIRQYTMGSFDSLNRFSVRGVSASGLGLIYDTLMISSPDEPSAEYGLIAEWVSYPSDYSSVTYGLREQARFHDGKPIRPEDIIFSLEALKKAHPFFKAYYKNVVSAEKTGEREVTFRFDINGNRELPQIVGQLEIIPEHFWTATSADGKTRDIAKSSLEIPLGSGPYKIKKVDPGRDIIYERDENYWAKDLPVTKGQWNFDEIAYRYYLDRTPAFEAFKTGTIQFWTENSAESWATKYSSAPFKKGLIKKEALKNGRVAGMQAFVFNLRREKFKDIRVREALNLVYNFDQANKTLFYGQYIRTGSFFENSELRASGKPKGTELEILKSVADGLPKTVFDEVWEPAKSSGSTSHRKNLRKALGLLKQAGWTLDKNVLRNAKGKAFKLEFLLFQPTFDRVVLPFIQDLRKIGIEASVRVVDSAQYKRRSDDFDFDIIIGSFGQSHSPGNEQRSFWGSASAKRPGSRNIAGIENPAIDKLIDRLVFAKGREDLVAATRALDRALLANYYVIPQWYYPFDRVAFWNYLSHPKKLPSQNPAVLRTWWVDPQKYSKHNKARTQ
ncbi:MAG: extracellular solute-binding protein [Hyphomicrobiaceae bacterium]